MNAKIWQLDRAVLTGGVRGLQHDQDRVRVGRIEALLRVGQIGDVLLEEFGRTRLELVFRQILELLAGGPARVVVGQADPPAGRNLEQSTNLFERERHTYS